MVFPIENFVENSPGEGWVWQKLKEYLPSNYVSLHNYNVDTQEVDVILFVPDAGVLIIELKGFYPKNIDEAIDNTNILMKNGGVERSPVKQARRYRSKFLDVLERERPELAKTIIGWAVGFPYFAKEHIKEKKLDRLCDSNLIFCRDDFEDWNSFSRKVSEVFEKTNKIFIPDAKNSNFNENDIKEIVDIYVPGFELKHEMEILGGAEVKEEIPYSILISDNSTNADEDRINKIVNMWSKGVKIYFFSNCKKMCQLITEKAQEYLNQIGLEELILNGSIFNLTVEYTDNKLHDFEIVNGEGLQYFYEKVDHLGKIVSFNNEQYKAEHASGEDMVVKAGAGTGKTYLLVSRIAYLCWKHKYASEELTKRIILITFTNDATDEMRDRLVKYFSSMFKLTFRMDYFKYAESVENMMISTIDSFGKRIISKFAYYLGLGTELTVTSGTMIKREEIREEINQFAQNSDLITASYHLEKFLGTLIDKIGNRSLDANELDECFNNACKDEPLLGGLVIKVPEIMRKVEKATEKANQILMSHIIVYLKRIVKMLKSGEIKVEKDNQIDYVFIDEFQDTDDTQIELVADFHRLFDFKLFVVGDPKQSIYRFRGASDDKAFLTLNEKIGYEINSYSLVKNYRSNAQLLNYMDKVFSKLSMKRQLLKYKDEDRLIGVINPKDACSVFKYDISVEEERETQFIKALEDFRQNSKEEENLAILVRSNSEIARIRDWCVKNNIMDVDIDSGGRLYKSEAVVDMYKLINALQNSRDASCLFNLYTTSYCNETVDKNELLNSKDKCQYFYEHLPESIKNWEFYVESLQKEPVLKVLRTIIDEVNPAYIFSQRCGLNDELKQLYEVRYRNNLDKLFEKIVLENNGDYLTISKLAEFLKIMITTHQEEEEREVEENIRIQCRTVHRAKGKEYTYVLFPFADERIQKEKYYGDSNIIILGNNVGYYYKLSDTQEIFNTLYEDLKVAELEDQSYEEARIFYVAVTRAKKGIIYINNLSKKKMKDAVLWQSLLEE